MKTVVIAKQRLLYDHIQNVGTEFEVETDDLKQLIDRDLVILASEVKGEVVLKEDTPTAKGLAEAAKQPPLTQQPSLKKAVLQNENKITSPPIHQQNLGTTAPKLDLRNNVHMLTEQEREIVKRKEAVFAGENKLIDREKELERRTRIIDQQEKDLALRLKKIEKQKESDCLQGLLTRSIMK